MLDQIDSSLVSALVPLFILLALGFLLFVAWLFWVLSRREQRKQAALAQDESGKASGNETELSGFSAQTTQVASSGSELTASTPIVESRHMNSDAVEVFRVLRDLADGSLIVEIDGTYYRKLSDITDGKVGRRFMANARALAHFALILKGPPPPAPPLTEATPPPTPPLTEATPPPAIIESTPEAQVPAPAQQSAPESPLVLPPLAPLAPVESKPVEPVKIRPLAGLRRQKKNADVEQEPQAEMINLADEIEALLQQRLPSAPQFAQRSIHVFSAAGGGVRIEVDGTLYEGVGDVADSEVREFIQATIREWEMRRR